MSRTYSTVMHDMAEIIAERKWTTIPSDVWPDLIREFSELPDPEYDRAMRSFTTLVDLGDVVARLARVDPP